MPYEPSLNDATQAEQAEQVHHMINNSSSMQSSQQPQYKDENLTGISNSPGINGILGAGDALANMMSLGYANPHSGSGTAYNIGRIGGNTLGYGLGGEVLGAGRAALESAPLIGKLAQGLGGEGLQGALRRTLGAGIAGAATDPNNRLQGAGEGAMLGGALEGIPGSLKGISSVAEYMNPKQFTQQLAKSIPENFNFAKQQASDVYQPVLDKFANYHITKNNPSSEYSNLNDSIKDYYGPDLKKMDSDFQNKPTFQNAHDLQSQLGTKIGQLSSKKMDAYTSNAVEGLRQARNSLRSDMFGFLNVRNPQAAEQYQSGTDIYRSAVAPFLSNKYVYDIAQGNKSDVDPNALLRGLTNIQDTTWIKPGHWLSENQQDLSQRVARGKTAANVMGVAGGALGLGLGGPAGAAVGGLAGKFLGPGTLNLAQNPSIVSAMGKAKNTIYEPLRQALIANLLGGQ